MVAQGLREVCTCQDIGQKNLIRPRPEFDQISGHVEDFIQNRFCGRDIVRGTPRDLWANATQRGLGGGVWPGNLFLSIIWKRKGWVVSNYLFTLIFTSNRSLTLGMCTCWCPRLKLHRLGHKPTEYLQDQSLGDKNRLRVHLEYMQAVLQANLAGSIYLMAQVPLPLTPNVFQNFIDRMLDSRSLLGMLAWEW